MVNRTIQTFNIYDCNLDETSARALVAAKQMVREWGIVLMYATYDDEPTYLMSVWHEESFDQDDDAADLVNSSDQVLLMLLCLDACLYLLEFGSLVKKNGYWKIHVQKELYKIRN